MSVAYAGITLFDCGVVQASDDEQDYALVLSKQTTVGTLRRFVSRELMEGTQYKNVATKALAVVIFTAFAHPSLRFVQRSVALPLWVEWIRSRESTQAYRTGARLRTASLGDSG